jgi:hypothetical protein
LTATPAAIEPACGLDDPFDAERAIDAQAHLMRDLLRYFCSVRLARWRPTTPARRAFAPFEIRLVR